MTEFVDVTCPACFQTFSVAAPPRSELPAEIDYDCEICCRPMMIAIAVDANGGLIAEATATGD